MRSSINSSTETMKDILSCLEILMIGFKPMNLSAFLYRLEIKFFWIKLRNRMIQVNVRCKTCLLVRDIFVDNRTAELIPWILRRKKWNMLVKMINNRNRSVVNRGIDLYTTIHDSKERFICSEK